MAKKSAGGDGDDSLVADPENDWIHCGAGNDLLNGQAHNYPPIAQFDQCSMNEGGSLVIDPCQGLLANDADLEGYPIAAVLLPPLAGRWSMEFTRSSCAPLMSEASGPSR